ncbi:quinone oxidoreductase [Tribonema minus]|uniref:Quinone oxidoreductase n=1 Tax=Tribonema minus TaxID=303371 RepID=A0A836CGA1_9STRA|nr:quinone oxidoreductase [Tribonema minus]
MAEGDGKAVLCEKFGPIDSLRYRTVARCPPPTPGHVVISVRACGVNFPDVLMVQGKYQVRPQLPFAAGGEVSGIIRDVGEGVTHFKKGDAVIGFCGYGGFATEITMKATAVAPLPPGMPFADAAGFLVTYMTSYYALKSRAQLAPGETVLVLGAAGGCGMAAVQVRQVQIEVDAPVSAVTTAAARTSQRLTWPRNAVGGTVTEESLRCLSRYGRHLVVGFAAGDIPRIPTNLLLLRQASLMGVRAKSGA